MKKLLIAISAPVLFTFAAPYLANAQPGALQPEMLACGQQGDAEVICGTRAPEDFELTPDGKFLIVAKFGEGDDSPLDLFDLTTQSFSTLPIISEPLDDWGVKECIDSIGDQVSPHGLSLSQRESGEWQFYVVNHRVRESMELYELQAKEGSWQLAWHGCIFAEEPYNDVSVLPDGSFVATRPQAIQLEGENIFGGQPTGNVSQWNAKEGETVLPGSEYGYPNGVLVSPDSRFAYVSGWTTRDFHKYDLQTQQEVGVVNFDFMPDNLTWTASGKILAAGIKDVSGNCPLESNDPCIQGFGIVEIDPETLAKNTLYDSNGLALINGTSVAIEVEGYLYVGSFQGDRMVKLSRK